MQTCRIPLYRGAFLTGNAGSLADALSSRGGGDKFTGLDIKVCLHFPSYASYNLNILSVMPVANTTICSLQRVYFGNWLRDYSQAMDIAGLSKLSGDSIVLVIMCLGFMAFGYATEWACMSALITVRSDLYSVHLQRIRSHKGEARRVSLYRGTSSIPTGSRSQTH